MLEKQKENLPYNFYAERVVLSSILMDAKIIFYIGQNLCVEAFYFFEHQEIYKACIFLFTEGKPIDATTIVSWLNDKKILQNIGGVSIISQLMEDIIDISNIEYYVSLVQEKYIRRLLIDLGKNIVNAGFQTNLSLETIFNEIEKKIFKITGKQKKENLVSLSELLSKTILELKKPEKPNSSLIGLSSSFPELDSILQGFQNSDLIIIAGRPSMGKTSFCLNMATNMAKLYDFSILIFSLEMSTQQLVYRFLSTEAEIDTNALRSGHLSSVEWKKVKIALEQLSHLDIFFDDTPNPSLTIIRFKIKKLLLKQKKLGLVIIDYLQLMADSKKIQNRVQELSIITRELKSIAREFNIPIIVLSQLSRNVEARTNKRPILSDLRESGCISGTTLFSQDRFFQQLNELTDLKKLKIFAWQKYEFQILNPCNIRATGIKPTFSILTTYGFKISTSSAHKFLTKTGWKKLDDLKQNNLLAIKIFYKNLDKIQFNSFFLWDSIVNINYIGLKKVYDLTIEGPKNFLANGIVVHNSIEQDADVVIMLYSENYYNELKENKKNLIELNVVKHRNGPIGKAILNFNPKITKFSSL